MKSGPHQSGEQRLQTGDLKSPSLASARCGKDCSVVFCEC
jgi:hypothetical protein